MPDEDLTWPPAYVDLVGERHGWDEIAEPDEETEQADDGPPITYRELAYEICDNWGGLEAFLDDQWVRQGR